MHVSMVMFVSLSYVSLYGSTVYENTCREKRMGCDAYKKNKGHGLISMYTYEAIFAPF